VVVENQRTLQLTDYRGLGFDDGRPGERPVRNAGVTDRKLEAANALESENLSHRDQPRREGGDSRLFRRRELRRVTIDLAAPRNERVERRDRGNLY
jgi:hypothetical protein